MKHLTICQFDPCEASYINNDNLIAVLGIRPFGKVTEYMRLAVHSETRYQEHQWLLRRNIITKQFAFETEFGLSSVLESENFGFVVLIISVKNRLQSVFYGIYEKLRMCTKDPVEFKNSWCIIHTLEGIHATFELLRFL